MRIKKENDSPHGFAILAVIVLSITDFLLSNLIIQNENMMKELIEIIYLKADIQKIVFTINNKNIDLLSKLLSRFIIQYKARNINTINSLVLLMQHPKLKALNK
jgi:hypothetical protein